MERIPYDEFAYFHENAAEFGLPYDGPPVVRRESVEVSPGCRLSALVWGTGEPEIVLLHGGAQNAHTWDTVAMALDRPLVAIDLPGHGHSDAGSPAEPGSGRLLVEHMAADVAAAIEALAPQAGGVVGMSLGGLTTLALTTAAPALVRRVVLVDVLPTLDPRGTAAIHAFIHGPVSFASFDDLLARTMEHNPTRSESSLRRGILHNAVQRDDGSWVWRYARHREGGLPAERDLVTTNNRVDRLWEAVSAIAFPIMLVRGMAAGSVVSDDAEKELLTRQPAARVEHVEGAGHSVQGDRPVELAQLIHSFIP